MQILHSFKEIELGTKKTHVYEQIVILVCHVFTFIFLNMCQGKMTKLKNEKTPVVQHLVLYMVENSQGILSETVGVDSTAGASLCPQRSK